MSEKSWLANNRAVLAEKHQEALAALEATAACDLAALVDAKGGKTSFRAREGEGAWVTLHSGVDPTTEAQRLVESWKLEGAGLIVVLGFGLGYHLEALLTDADSATLVVAMEPASHVLQAALKARDLGPLLEAPNLRLIVEARPEEAMRRLARIRLTAGFPRLKVCFLPSARRAMPQTYEPLAGLLSQAEQARIEDKLIYPKFIAERVKVLLLHGKYFLIEELKNTFAALGHDLRLVLLQEEELAAEEVIRNLISQIVQFRPDFILTINHLGFDRDGVLTNFLSQIRMPFASWYVDSPLLIIRHYQENRSPWGSIFLWDSDYLAEIKELGYEEVCYLPLAADDSVFKPLGPEELPSWGKFPIAFVGNSMRDAIAKKTRELAVTESEWPLIDRAAELFTFSSDRYLGRFLAEVGLDQRSNGEPRSEAELIDLEALVLWRATQLYRLASVLALTGLETTIAGDDGWRDLLPPEQFQLHPPLNYYRQLPFFYNLTEVNFNATSLQMKTGLNQRVFDVPACGRFLLTDQRDQLDQLFEPGQETAVYHSPEEARELAVFYRDHPEARKKIAAAAHQRVMAEHTYRHRLSELVGSMRRRFSGMTWQGQSV